jgi:acetyltransferase-like isoleucine patch superfamily enzyme
MRMFRLMLRVLANSCIFPGLRRVFWRLSGLKIGKDTFLNLGLTVIDNYRGNVITLGERVAVAPKVILIADSDPNHSILSKTARFITRGTITIDDDTWIGAGVIILPNVHVGKCAVIGAGSIVTEDVNDYAIMVGNPARKIGDTRDKVQAG